jgi:RHH-type proline utilization regulon transcriptional repressor/proline dehydrogenase/delta 1-pyrroline-5-carboxylate dehydrogenase
MIFAEPLPVPSALRAQVRALHRADETACVEELLRRASLPSDALDRIADRARGLVRAVRERRTRQGGLDAFLHEYALSSREGIVLMCLAEALLRIPDADTADRLIRDKIGGADWERHVGRSESVFVNASTWALMLTGRIVGPDSDAGDWSGIMKRMVARSGEPVIRAAVVQAMRIMGRQFVMGRTIGEALERAARRRSRATAIPTTCWARPRARRPTPTATWSRIGRRSPPSGRAAKGAATIHAAPTGISVKLSALHPALRVRAAPPRVGRTGAAAGRARAGTRQRHRPDGRRRGGGPAGPVARPHRRGGGRSRRSRAGRASASRSRPTRSARPAVIDWLADCAHRWAAG